MSESAVRILNGHVINAFRALPEKSVHAIVTSPPYWARRSYEDAVPQIWGGRAECKHSWSKTTLIRGTGGRQGVSSHRKGRANVKAQEPPDLEGRTCRRCKAWLGNLGNEPTLDQFIRNLVFVFSEARRVLRDDGILVVNLADSMVNKSKLFAPHRFAIAMVEDGWVARQDCIWHKENPQRESVKDRPTTAHEFCFLFSKRGAYFWDRVAVLTPFVESTLKQLGQDYRGQSGIGWEKAGAPSPSDAKRSIIASLGNNILRAPRCSRLPGGGVK